MSRRHVLAAGLCCALFIAGSKSFAQPSYVLAPTPVTADITTVATSSVLFDNSVGLVRGWSYGLCADASIVQPIAVVPGLTTATIKNGNPPDFQSLDLYAGGFTQGVLICFTSCAALPTGVDFELARVSYAMIGNPGFTTNACFCASLGSPPVPVVIINAASESITPMTQCAPITVTGGPTPATNFACQQTVVDCICDVNLTWQNGAVYDSIDILEDGVVIATLPGTATSYTVTGVVGLHTYCHRPDVDGIPGALRCCTVDCPDLLVPATPVVFLTCTIDPSTCLVSMSWFNSSTYSFLQVFVDGVLATTVSGTSQFATVQAGPTTSTICVRGETPCGDAIPQTCCTVLCEVQFRRGDVNGDGSLNIADGIAFLGVLFVGGALPTDCPDAYDSNDDGATNIADVIFSLTFLFSAGPAPAAPYPACGLDPTADGIDCDDFADCE
ncbi:MAG: hypothetical protein ACKVX7_16880 [Planctomycetota bacterium]